MEKRLIKYLEWKTAFFLLFLGVVVFVSIKYTPEIISLISNTSKFKDYINSYGTDGILVYIIFNILHIIIVVIPGELLQIAGGYIYGTFWGTVYTFTGMFIGIVIVFFSTRLFGFSVIKIFLPKDKLSKFDHNQ
jgi:uncharacterized membrane protein YdjX (TVP38/TMEM64 family)